MYTHTKIAIPAGSSHLPKPSNGRQCKPWCCTKLVLTGALPAPVGGQQPDGCCTPRGAVPQSHPVAGSPGKPPWVSPGSLCSQYFHTGGFCTGLQGRAKGIIAFKLYF